MKTKLKMMLIAAFAASMVFVVKAADYTLASGQTDTISASATYGAMTVNGALTLANGAKSTSVTADSLTVGGDAEHGYGSVTLGGLPTLSVGNLTLDDVAGLDSSDPISYLTLNNATVKTSTITNKSSRAARIDCYGNCTLKRSSTAVMDVFSYGDHEVVLHDGATLEFYQDWDIAGNFYAASSDATLAITGSGDAKFASRPRFANGKYGLNFTENVALDFDGDLYLVPTENNRKPCFTFRDGNVIRPNVNAIKAEWQSSWDGSAVTILVFGGVALTVPSVEVCQTGATLKGESGSSVVVDARSEARTFKANIPSGDPLTVCATGTCEIVVSSTPNIPHLVLYPGSCVRFTDGCVIEDITIGKNATIIADGCEVVLASGFATDGRSLSQAYQTANGGTFVVAQEGVTWLRNPSPDMTGFHFASGSNIFSAVGLDKKYWRFTFMKTLSGILSLRGLYLFDENGTWINELGTGGYVGCATEENYTVLAEGKYRFYCNSATNVTSSLSYTFSNQDIRGLKHVFSFGADSAYFPHLASPVLNEDDPLSWLSVEFALTNGHERATGYNLRYYNQSAYMQSWKVYVSDDCENWVEVDVRTNEVPRENKGQIKQRCTMDGVQYNKDDIGTLGTEYYTFDNVRVDGLEQTKPFSLQVDSGAAADLRAYTGGCVVSNLTIVAGGASDGVIYGAKLAESGTVNIILTEGDLPQCLPLRLPDVLNSENLGNWQVYVNGTPTNKKLFVLKGAVMLRQNGFVIIVQ